MTASAEPSPLLLCIDLQPIFLSVMSEGAALLRRCEFAVSAAQGLGIGVIFIEQASRKLGATAPELLALAPQARQFEKSTFSAMADDGIRDALRASGANHLVICGLETPVCIYQTAIDAIGVGMPVTLLSDCIGSRRPADAAVALDALRHAGVAVLPSETVFCAMLHDVRHPFFKDFLQLDKRYA